MENITSKTILKFTEIKRGHASGKIYEMRAGDFIDHVKNRDCDGHLDIEIEPILDEEGEIIDFTPNKFYDLSITEQLDMCCSREGESYASNITYEVA